MPQGDGTNEYDKIGLDAAAPPPVTTPSPISGPIGNLPHGTEAGFGLTKQFVPPVAPSKLPEGIQIQAEPTANPYDQLAAQAVGVPKTSAPNVTPNVPANPYDAVAQKAVQPQSIPIGTATGANAGGVTGSFLGENNPSYRGAQAGIAEGAVGGEFAGGAGLATPTWQPITDQIDASTQRLAGLNEAMGRASNPDAYRAAIDKETANLTTLKQKKAQAITALMNIVPDARASMGGNSPGIKLNDEPTYLTQEELEKSGVMHPSTTKPETGFLADVGRNVKAQSAIPYLKIAGELGEGMNRNIVNTASEKLLGVPSYAVPAVKAAGEGALGITNPLSVGGFVGHVVTQNPLTTLGELSRPFGILTPKGLPGHIDASSPEEYYSSIVNAALAVVGGAHVIGKAGELARGAAEGTHFKPNDFPGFDVSQESTPQAKPTFSNPAEQFIQAMKNMGMGESAQSDLQGVINGENLKSHADMQTLANRLDSSGRLLQHYDALTPAHAGEELTAPIDQLTGAMQSLGFHPEQVAGIRAALNPVLEQAQRQGISAPDIVAATANQIDPSGKLLQEYAKPFYSKLEQVVTDKVPNNATPDQVRATLVGNGVKPEEMAYTGVNQFLDDAQGPIPKSDLLDHIRDNQVQVGEVWKSKSSPGPGFDTPDTTKYSQYTLPGGKNYRELLLTLPDNRAVGEVGQRYQELLAKNDAGTLTDREQAELNRISARSSQENYVSNHWAEPNVLAHVRMDDRAGPNGEKILHVAEVQSDWGQGLRKSRALRDVAKPQSVRELSQNFFGRQLASGIPLSQVDAGMLATIQHAEVARHIISLLPVDVVDELGGNELATENLRRNPAMVFDSLPVGRRSTVAKLVLDSARQTFAVLRAKLADGLKRGRDVEILPALRASDLSAREVVGALAPDSLYHEDLAGSPIGFDVAGSGAKESPLRSVAQGDRKGLPATDTEFLNAPLSALHGAEADSAGAGSLGGDRLPARIAEALDWHNSIIDQAGRSKPVRYEATDLPRMPFERSWQELAMKRVLRHAAENGSSPDWDAATKPQSIREKSEHVLGRELAAVTPLKVMDAAMLDGLQNNQIRGAVVKSIPIDVVNVLTKYGLTPEHLASHPKMVSDRLSVPDRATVARGFASALELVGARMRATLRRVLLSPESGGRNGEDLSAIRASNLDPSIVSGLLSPVRRYGIDGDVPLSGLGSTDTTAKLSVPGFNDARVGAEPSPTELARALNRHDEIIHGHPPNAVAKFDPGYSKISWDTGATSNDRYDLAKQVDRIDVARGQDQGIPSDHFVVRAFKGGKEIGNDSMSGEKLPDYIGKELATRVASDFEHGNPGKKSYEGQDLTVGGSGQKGFYDKILPDFVNKYTKKFGGKVEASTVGTEKTGKLISDGAGGLVREGTGDARQVPVHSLDLTPELKRSVLNEGQPLFQERNGQTKGFYDRANYIIGLVKGKADVSTVVHEVGHFFHDVLLQHPDYAETIRKNYGDMSDTEGAEKFAKHFEGYLKDGKAPIKSLQTVFAAVKEWMKQVYARWTGGKASPDVKAIFDRVYSHDSPETQRLVQEFDRLTAAPKPEGVPEETPPEPQEAGATEYNAVPPETDASDRGSQEALSPEADVVEPPSPTEGANEPTVTGLARRFEDAERIARGQEPQPTQGVSMKDMLARGKDLVDSGHIDVTQTLKSLHGRIPTDDEFLAMQYQKARLFAESETLGAESLGDVNPARSIAIVERQNDISKELDQLSAASANYGGRFHKMGMILQIALNTKDYSLAGLKSRARQAVPGEDPSPSANTTIENQATRIAQLTKDLEAEKAKTIENLSKPSTGVAATPLKNKEATLARIRKLTSEQASKGPLVGGVPRGRQTGAIDLGALLPNEAALLARDLRSLVRHYIGEGTTDGASIMRRLNADLPHLSEENILDLMSGKYKAIRIARTAAELHADQILNQMRQAGIQRQKGVVNLVAKSAWQTLNGFTRNANLGGHASAPFMQGRKVLAADPKAWLKAWPEMVKGYGGGDNFLNHQMARFMSDPLWDRAQAAGLDKVLAKPHGTMADMDDYFMKNLDLSAKLPVFNKVTEHSGAAFNGFLNEARWQMFKNVAKIAPHDAPFLKAMANEIGVLTGRSTSALAKASAPLGQGLFSPRYTISKWEYATGKPLFEAARVSPQARNLIAKRYARVAVGYTIAAVAAAKYFGGTVDLNPESADFGHLKVGNNLIDIFAQEGEPMKLIAQTFLGRISESGKESGRSGEPLYNYVRNKTTPALKMLIPEFKGGAYNVQGEHTKDMFGGGPKNGRPFDWGQQLKDLIEPITVKGVEENMRKGGGNAPLLNIVGISTRTMNDGKAPKGPSGGFGEMGKF